MNKPQADFSASLPSIEQQDKSREQLQKDIEAFLANGGKVTHCDSYIGNQPTYHPAQRDSRRARDRVRLRNINAALIQKYREKLEKEPGYLLSLAEMSAILGVSEESLRRWSQRSNESDELLRPAVEDPHLWELEDLLQWYDRLKARGKTL